MAEEMRQQGTTLRRYHTCRRQTKELQTRPEGRAEKLCWHDSLC